MTQHATCPTVCPACRDKVITLFEQTSCSPVVSHCTHKSDAGQLVLIIAHALGGAIQQWDLQGPMTFERAQSHAAFIAELCPPKHEYRPN